MIWKSPINNINQLPIYFNNDQLINNLIAIQ